MKDIAKVLEEIGRFSENDLLLFKEKIKIRNIQKGEVLLREGDVCQSAFYALSGSFYQYSIKDEIDENVIDLHLENEWFLNEQSFISQKPSQNIIKSYSEGTVIELSMHVLHALIGISPAFFQLGSILEQSKSRVHFFDNNLNPTQKYDYIISHKPILLQKFPLKIIASYLKITPETLSRVRESLTKRKSIS